MKKYVFVLMAILVFCSVCSMSSYAGQGYPLTVSWTAPGDDGNVGTCAAYDLRVFDGHLNVDTNTWGFGTSQSGTPTPLPAGTTQYMTIIVPEWMCEFTLNIRARDEMDNWSPPSNSCLFNKPLGIPYPNPFNPQTDQMLTIPCVPANDSVLFYAADGTLIRTLVSTGEVEWDGKNTQGQIVAPGFYFYQLPAQKVLAKIQIKR